MRSLSCRPRIHIQPRRYYDARDGNRDFVSRASLITRRNTNVKLVEPPSSSSPSTIVFIGRNSRGNWVAQEQNGLYGGLFVNRAQAVKYALFENGHHPETIVELSREIELDMGGMRPSSDRTSDAGTRRAA
jgi:hypothetical protein